MAILYFLMGAVFTYMAFTYADETVFNPLSMVFLLVAALDFFVGFRYIKRNKEANQNKK